MRRRAVCARRLGRCSGAGRPSERVIRRCGWQVAEWVERRLSPGEQAEVQVAQRRSIETLRRELAVAQPQELGVVAGLPRPAESLRLLAELESRLWSERAASAD